MFTGYIKSIYVFLQDQKYPMSRLENSAGETTTARSDTRDLLNSKYSTRGMDGAEKPVANGAGGDAVVTPCPSHDASTAADTLHKHSTKPQDVEDFSWMISAHEEQLSDITSFCKAEMRLLIAVKTKQITYTDYLRSLYKTLNAKSKSIGKLKERIESSHLVEEFTP